MMQEPDLKYLELLSRSFPNIAATTTEIINLEAILNLPKGTEHFISDLHGEYEAFEHVLRNGSGNVKTKINEIFKNHLTQKEINQLATIVYYPEEKMQLVLKEIAPEDRDDWYRVTISRLTELMLHSATKYTRSKVRKALPEEFSYIIEELLSKEANPDKDAYYDEIITSIIELDTAEELIKAMCYAIQRLVVDHLHVLGDIYDRGPYPDKIVDRLMSYHSVDIQWGNHDVLWFGAASGSPACVANVLRISARYDNLETLEDAYGISLRPFLAFAEATYGTKSAPEFFPRVEEGTIEAYPDEQEQLGVIQQAISIIQFKLEGQIIKRNPNFKMEDRLLLEKIDYNKGTIDLYGKTYKLRNTNFPTIDPKDPYALSEDEAFVMERLVQSFKDSKRLQSHTSFLINNGGMYLVYNDNLLYHGCIPLKEDGGFMGMKIGNKTYSGKALFDMFDNVIRRGFFNQDAKDNDEFLDLVWYLWTGEVSPLFGKTRMTTFERYYIEDKDTHTEPKNSYYSMREDYSTVKSILEEFGLDARKSHIINGHTPVKEKKGEDPMKARNRLLVIDGGLSKAYQGTTGIGGYTLLYNSYGMTLATHEPFASREEAIRNETDIVSTRRIVDTELQRKKIADTDIGARLKQESSDLRALLKAYRSGAIKEKSK